MALKCRCICGCKLLVASDSAGKRIKCPKCERKLRVPVDLVEKRRAQLESRKPSPQPTPPRSKIDKPLSSLVDLPEPEPPPIQTGEKRPSAATSQPSEPAMSLVPPPLKTPSSTTSSPPALAEPVSLPVKPPEFTDTLRKPPPLPKRSEDRAKTLVETFERENPPESVEEALSPSLSPAAITPVSKSDPEPAKTDAEKERAPQLETDDVELPVRGYAADRKHVATVRWLAAAILLTGLVGTVPAIIDIVEHTLSDSSVGLSRWACALLLVGLLQCAYAVYLVQLPDWSSVWVVTIFTLAIAASYAAMFGLTLLSSDQGHFVQLLDLADRLRGGKATAWCLIMLSLMSLTSYFSGHVAARWRNAFVG